MSYKTVPFGATRRLIIIRLSGASVRAEKITDKSLGSTGMRMFEPIPSGPKELMRKSGLESIMSAGFASSIQLASLGTILLL